MSFSQILFRGVAAANRVPVGLLLYLLLLGLQQGLNSFVGSLISPQALQIKPGEEPPPELFALIGFGCFTCVWGLVALFATPWVTGGVVGRLRDRIVQPENPPGRFAEYAGRFYGRMLVLALIWIAVFAALWIVMMIVGAAIVGSTVQPGQQIQPEQWQEMNRHPANIASAFVLILSLTLIGVVWSVAQAIVVIDDKGPLNSLGDAVRFFGRHPGDIFKLFLVFALLGIVLWIPGPLMMVFDVEQMAVRVLVAVFIALYFPYLVMVQLGCGASLYLARRPQVNAESVAG